MTKNFSASSVSCIIHSLTLYILSSISLKGHYQTQAFVNVNHNQIKPRTHFTSPSTTITWNAERRTRNPFVLKATENDIDVGNVDDDDDENDKIPCLPSIGASSFGSSDNDDESTTTMSSQTMNNKKIFVGSDKLELQYTCKICEYRNINQIRRIAYRKGVVISVCKGCKSKHLIADNLGWSNYIGGFEGETNIEKYLDSKGREEDHSRVSKDVFELEKMLHITNGDDDDDDDKEGVEPMM